MRDEAKAYKWIDKHTSHYYIDTREIVHKAVYLPEKALVVEVTHTTATIISTLGYDEKADTGLELIGFEYSIFNINTAQLISANLRASLTVLLALKEALTTKQYETPEDLFNVARASSPVDTRKSMVSLSFDPRTRMYSAPFSSLLTAAEATRHVTFANKHLVCKGLDERAYSLYGEDWSFYLSGDRAYHRHIDRLKGMNSVRTERDTALARVFLELHGIASLSLTLEYLNQGQIASEYRTVVDKIREAVASMRPFIPCSDAIGELEIIDLSECNGDDALMNWYERHLGVLKYIDNSRMKLYRDTWRYISFDLTLYIHLTKRGVNYFKDYTEDIHKQMVMESDPRFSVPSDLLDCFGVGALDRDPHLQLQESLNAAHEMQDEAMRVDSDEPGNLLAGLRSVEENRVQEMLDTVDAYDDSDVELETEACL